MHFKRIKQLISTCAFPSVSSKSIFAGAVVRSLGVIKNGINIATVQVGFCIRQYLIKKKKNISKTLAVSQRMLLLVPCIERGLEDKLFQSSCTASISRLDWLDHPASN